MIREDCVHSVVDGGHQEARPGRARSADALGYPRELQLGDGSIVVLDVQHETAICRAPYRRCCFRHLLCR